MAQPHDHNEMPDKIAFSGGERGKLYRESAWLQLPVHLEADVQNTLTEMASAERIDFSIFVNGLLRKDIASLA